MPSPVETAEQTAIRKIPSEDLGGAVVEEFKGRVRAFFSDPRLGERLALGGTPPEREKAFKRHAETFNREYQSAVALLENYPPSYRRIFERELSNTYYALKVTLAEGAGLRDEALSARLELISHLVGGGSPKLDKLALSGASELEVGLVDGEKGFENLWGFQQRKVPAIPFKELTKVGEAWEALSEQEKDILFSTTLLAGEQLLEGSAPKKAFQISQLLQAYLGRNGGSDEQRALAAGLEVTLFRKLKLPQSAFEGAEKLYLSASQNLKKNPSPENLVAALHGAALLAETMAELKPEGADTPFKIRALRQEIEAVAGGLIRRNGEVRKEYLEAAPLVRGVLVEIQKTEIDAFRNISNAAEGDKTLKHLERHYREESETIRKVYSRESSLTDRLGAGARNLLHEFTQTPVVASGGAMIAGCGIGVKAGAVFGLPGAGAGCAFGAGLGLLGLSLGHSLYRYDRIGDGFSTGHTPHDRGLFMALEMLDAVTTVAPPVKTTARLFNGGVKAALKGAPLAEKTLGKLGLELDSTSLDVKVWNEIFKVFPDGVPADTKLYRFSEEQLREILSNREFQRELKEALGGPGRIFADKILAVTRSGRDFLTREELNAVFARAAVDYVGNAGPVVWSAGVVGALGGLSAMAIEEYRGGEFDTGSVHYLQSVKHLTMMLAFSVALHKTQSRLIAGSGELSTLKLPDPQMITEARFLSDSKKLGVPSEKARALFRLHKEVRVASDPVIEKFYTGKFRRDTLARATNLQQVTGQSVHYVEFDIGGLGSLNEHLARAGRGNAEANRHFRAIAEIAANRLGGIADVVPFRHGGDEFSVVLTLHKGVPTTKLGAVLQEINADVRRYVRSNNLDKIPPIKKDRPAGLGIYVGEARVSRGVTLPEMIANTEAQRYFDATANYRTPVPFEEIFQKADQLVELAKKNNPDPKVSPVKPVERRGEIPKLPEQIGQVSTESSRPRFIGPDDLLEDRFVRQGRRIVSSIPEETLRALAPKYERHGPTDFIAHTTGQLVNTMRRAGEFSVKTGQPAFFVEGSFRGLQSLNSLFGLNGADTVFREVARIFEREVRKVGGDVSFFHRGGGELGAVIVNVDSRSFAAVSEKVSKEVALLPTKNELLKRTLAERGLKEIPPAKPGDLPGLHFDTAWAPLWGEGGFRDAFRAVEDAIWQKRERRGKTSSEQ